MNQGDRIKRERERLGYNQTDFAAMAGATKHSQINWEKGLSSPNGMAFEVWAKAGLDVLYVITGQRSVAVVENFQPQQSTLTPRQAALLNNYDNTSEEGKRIIEAAAFAAAEQVGTATRSR